MITPLQGTNTNSSLLQTSKVLVVLWNQFHQPVIWLWRWAFNWFQKKNWNQFDE